MIDAEHHIGGQVQETHGRDWRDDPPPRPDNSGQPRHGARTGERQQHQVEPVVAEPPHSTFFARDHGASVDGTGTASLASSDASSDSGMVGRLLGTLIHSRRKGAPR